MSVLRVACVQLNSRDDVAANVATATALIDEAVAAGARLVALPETWAFKGASVGIRESAEPLDGPSNAALGARAAKHGVWVLAGSHYETSPDPARVYNTSVLYGPDGVVRAVYRKIHLFDAVSRGMVYRESDDLLPGEALVTAEVDGVTVGLTICYDLRFPELYRALALKGAQVLLVPSAFTAYTGAAHWEVLLRARAIENTCFVVAPDQVGAHLPGRECYGHSMILDPWGLKLAELEEGVGFCVAELDLARLEEVRAQIPSLIAQRGDVP